jgi:hypothetical protein
LTTASGYCQAVGDSHRIAKGDFMNIQDNDGKNELIEIYNELLPSTKKQILDIARIVKDTQEILVNEYMSKKLNASKKIK